MFSSDLVFFRLKDILKVLLQTLSLLLSEKISSCVLSFRSRLLNFDCSLLSRALYPSSSQPFQRHPQQLGNRHFNGADRVITHDLARADHWVDQNCKHAQTVAGKHIGK